MARYALVVVLCLGTPVSAGVWGQATGGGAGIRFVDIDGRRVRVRTLGVESSNQGTLVVFEAGASNSLGVWDRVLPEVAAFAPTLAYDRAGLGESEWDDQPPTPQHVADRLRRVLASTDAKPPYVLVGYSWGGILIRYFAGLHPSEVAGLVFVDPAPLVTESLADNLAPFEAVGARRMGYDALLVSISCAARERGPSRARGVRRLPSAHGGGYGSPRSATTASGAGRRDRRREVSSAARTAAPLRRERAFRRRCPPAQPDTARMGPSLPARHAGGLQPRHPPRSPRGSGSDYLGSQASAGHAQALTTSR
jgi:pimeloyl-ACP methyl ester carboxylesterase